jgi:hypothetical protein
MPSLDNAQREEGEEEEEREGKKKHTKDALRTPSLNDTWLRLG